MDFVQTWFALAGVAAIVWPLLLISASSSLREMATRLREQFGEKGWVDLDGFADRLVRAVNYRSIFADTTFFRNNPGATPRSIERHLTKLSRIRPGWLVLPLRLALLTHLVLIVAAFYMNHMGTPGMWEMLTFAGICFLPEALGWLLLFRGT